MRADRTARLPPVPVFCARYSFFQVVVLIHGPERTLLARAMSIDPQEFMHHLDGLDLDEARKSELIHNVAAFMESVIDQALGTHPVQLALVARQRRDSNGPAAALASTPSELLEPFNRFAAERAKREAHDQ